MNAIDLKAAFEKYDEEFLKFALVENPTSKRPDLCAFITLDRLVPGNRDLLGSAEHDEIYIDVDCNALAEAATEEDILLLVRCGVRYSSEYDSLCMFV